MPIFMDRHDLPGLTAVDVAEGHREDLKIQDQFNCRALTYWFDEERETAFCLIEAPDKKSVKALHDTSHGLIPNRIIEVDTGLVEAFLGRIEDPDPGEGHDTRGLHVFSESAFRIILAAEIKNRAELNLSRGMTETLEFLRSWRQHTGDILTRYNSREIKHSGGQLLASFASAGDALDCAVNIQTEFGSSRVQPAPALVIGLSAGEPVTGERELFGEAIRLAQQLCYIGREQQIVVSPQVKDRYESETLNHVPKYDTLTTIHPEQEAFLVRLMEVTETIWNRSGITAAGFARRMRLSKSQFYRRMKALTGTTPAEFIRAYRLEKALSLLDDRRLNIAEIAFETGFSNPSYFSKCFRNRYGLLPSRYRDRLG